MRRAEPGRVLRREVWLGRRAEDEVASVARRLGHRHEEHRTEVKALVLREAFDQTARELPRDGAGARTRRARAEGNHRHDRTTAHDGASASGYARSCAHSRLDAHLVAVHFDAALFEVASGFALTLGQTREHEQVHDAELPLAISLELDLAHVRGREALLELAGEGGLRLIRRRGRVHLAGDLPGELLLRLLWRDLLHCERGDDLFHFGPRQVRGPFEVVRHERVVDGHDLAVDLVRLVREPYPGLRLRLAHLLAVEPLEQRHDEDLLWWLAHLHLQLAAGQDVEELVGPAELDVGLDGHRVVRLEQRVEQVLDRDGRLLLHALAELLAREHLLRGEASAQLDDVAQAELREPLGLENDPAALFRDDLVELLEVRIGVLQHLLVRHRRPRLVLVRRVADLRRPVTDDQDDLVAPPGERAELAQSDGVADVQVRPRRIETHLDTQLPLACP